MAMTLPLSPASDAHPASPGTTSANNSSASGNNNNNSNNSNTNGADASATSISTTGAAAGANTNTSPTNTSSSAAAAAAAAAANMKRKPSRRANTAERRATHNAVERQRRETLNGRFLDLAALLPNLSQIRRPSKSSIVNSSIAHIHASRRHRLLASRELRLLKLEADALRREINEWRDRAQVPRVEEPMRGEGFGMVLSGELEVVGVVGEEEGEEGDLYEGEERAGYNGAVGGGGQGGYMEDVEEEYGSVQLGYPQHQQAVQQQQQQQQQMAAAAAAQAHHAHQQQQQQMGMMGGSQHSSHQHPHAHQQQHHLDDLDDPRVAALLLKNAAAASALNAANANSGPFAHSVPSSGGGGGGGSGSRPGTGGGYEYGGHYYQGNNGYPQVPSQGGYPTDKWSAALAHHQQAQHHQHPHQQHQHQQHHNQQQHHLFTPPATAHGLPPTTVPSHAARPGTAGSMSSSGTGGSPVMPTGLSVNTLSAMSAASSHHGSHHGSPNGGASPVSTSSSAGGGGIHVPPNTAVSPGGFDAQAGFYRGVKSHPSLSHPSSHPHPSQQQHQGGGRQRSGSLGSGHETGSPAYELHAHAGMGGEYVPRFAGHGAPMNGMGGMMPHMMANMGGMTAGGGGGNGNGAMMMMMM